LQTGAATLGVPIEYIPPDPKDDKALHTALDLIRGIQKSSVYPPKPKAAVPN
jgi:carboxyl-terminal processing protease